ncbi:nephrocystin-4 [Neosynchiropus ocellatus]
MVTASLEAPVRTDRGTSMADEWREVFGRSRLVPASSQTARLAAERHLSQSCGIQLTLSRVAASHLPKEDRDAESSVSYQLRATLFDRNHQCFFGKTWHSSQQRMRNNKISFNEVLYFHTSLRMPSTVVVLELVGLSLKPDSSQQALGQGLTVLELFSGKADAPAAEENRRLVLHHGSPRSLLHPLLKDIADCNILLKTVDGAHLDCSVKSHPALLSMMHLLPENVLVSGGESIPGVVESPSGDSLSRPQLLKMTAFSLNRLTISLQPSLEKFESQLLQLVNTDCQNTKQQGHDCSQKSVVIQERRLHVGVHNGWCFIDKPQVVVLEPTFSGLRGRADSTSKHSSQAKDSLPAPSVPQTLSLRSSLELQLTNHKALAIVFQLEYVFSAPIGRETMLSSTSTSRAAFLQCLRWGVWCPFSGSAKWRGEEIRLDLVGGTNTNPYGVMAYSTDVSVRTSHLESISNLDTSQVSDTIQFQLSSSLERTASSPKVSLRGKQENGSHRSRTSSSPLHGRSNSPVALLDSPQGPGLSMSQLAATSRYPTISHSSSVLPWQQSFPSLLHPSLLASAHQLSHVACSAVSNISHLEIDLEPHRDVSSSQDEGEQLQELPFTPVHAPVITLGTSASSSHSASSRSSLAHLFSAGFPDLLDCSGQVAEVLDPTESMPFDIHREEKDLLQDNLMVFQFLAFSRFQGEGAELDWPNNIYFTFQFYRFPPVTSQQMKLLTSHKVQVKPSSMLPCVLASINTDGSVSSGSPGLQVQFKVDDTFLRPGEKRWFLRYLALHTMHIDIWDSDSLLLIGSTAIELKYMLRQGKKAVQALHEVDVLTTNYMGEETLLTSPEVGHSNPPNPTVVHTVLRGRLHIRTGNIGCHVNPGIQHGELTPAYSHIITPRKVIGGFRGGCLSTPHIIQVNAQNTAHVQRLKAVTQRLSSLSRADGKQADKCVVNGLDSGRHKLERMAAVYQREGKGDFKTTEVTDQNADVRLARELHLAHARENKAEVIGNMLSQAITTQHLLFASLGSAEYMEFVLRNPYNVPQTVSIHSDDPELSVLTDAEEWRYFKTLTKTPTVLEEDMFNLEDISNGPKVYLRPKESVHIPLKYQSFLCDQASGLQGPSFLLKGKSSMAKKTLSNIIRAKTVKVSFKAEDGKLLAICQVNVQPTPHVVDQTFRLYHPELCFVKKAIRLPPWSSPNTDEDVMDDLSVRCSDPNVICQTRMLVPGEPQDVFLKVPGSPSPHVKMFFVMVFIDRWRLAPSQIWQIYVHFLERVDVSCVTGQQVCQSLVLRGKQALRKVKCFSSHPLELKVDPASVFMLPPAAVQELQLKLLPWRTGSRFLFVNAVDVEQRRLVSGWLLCLNVHRPVLSKAFEVHVPVRRGRGSSRKISYTNPYASSRTFLLRSDHPDLLQFKEDQFKVGAGEVYTIGLRFAPSQSPGSAEILVYVNNLEEKTEETFCVKVVYS